MDIQYFITFREVARSLNFTRAAERLGFAQPTITVQIQKLEKEFNIHLFARAGKSLKLTAEGTKLLQYADRIVDAYREAGESFTALAPMDIKIGTIETLAAYYLPPYLQIYRKNYQNNNMTILPSFQEDIIEKVKQGYIDFGIIIDSPFSNPELRTVTIRKEELVVICPPGHPFEQLKEITFQEMQDSSLIMTEKGCTYGTALERALDNGRINYQVVSELGSIGAIKQCVIYGLGAAMIPRITVLEEIKQNQLIAIPLKDGLLPPFYTQIIISTNKHLPPELEALITLLSSAE
ncbi:LysR family transcriptional regulator [Paenibacillus psychroresistens]|uniref:LysR family transcriptional regulator n=1 Tax=Paenibacillus psychroresistens TaxID=1778678 RepID=A0A6B8RJW8_9BACL|nr:LysR family transcriptional regulator [Paenibacillus psychroresistens]QGQ95905.1 LysR family transcriptional regulator [Paenibacillus psychroresistens]